MRRLTCLFTALLILFAFALPAVGEDLYYHPDTYPIVDETMEFTIAVAFGAGFQGHYEDMVLVNEQNARTNIKIHWIEIPEESYVEKVKLMLASNTDLPDAFMGGTFPTNVVNAYAAEGIIIPLDNLVDNVTHNIKAQLEKYPDFRKLMTSVNGSMNSLWSCEAVSNRLCVGRCLAINTEWLSNVGLSMPTTFTEFNDMLYAFKEKDGNGNGVIGDEMVFSGAMYTSPNMLSAAHSISTLSGFFNIADDNSHVMIKDDVCLYTPVQPQYRDYVTWLHQLYVDGILDPEIFTQNSTQYLAKAKSPESIGLGFANNIIEVSGKENNRENTQFRAMEPIVGYYGEMMNTVSPYIFPNTVENTFFITNACEHPEALMLWMDYWFDGGENALNWRFAGKDIGWEYLPDVGPETWSIMSVEDSNNFYARYCPSYLGAYWILTDQADVRYNPGLNGEFQNMVSAKWNPLKIQTWPNLSLDEEDNELYLEIDSELRKYSDNMFFQFVFDGVTDESWNSYVKTCEAYGYTDMLALLQTRWDAFQGK